MLKNIKYVHPDISEIIRFYPGYVSSLVIEDQDLFRKIAEDFYVQSEGAEGDGILSDDNNSLNIGKYTEMIAQYVPFDINRKSLQAKLYTALERVALDPEHYLGTQELLGNIENSISEWSECLDVELDHSRLSVSSVIKSSGVRFLEDTVGTLEKILDFMEIVREFEGDKLFVFFQLRSYFSYADVKLFLETAVSRDYFVLLIDSAEYDRLDFERRIVIDPDLCLI